MDSPAVSVLVREVVACAVMLPVFDMLSDPDFYNRTIDDKVRCDGLGRPPRLPSTDQTACSPSPRRRRRHPRPQDGQRVPRGSQQAGPRTRRRRHPAALPAVTVASAKAAPGRKTEVVTVRTSPRQFDAWLANIGTLTTLGDARRLRSDVTSQIRRAKLATGAQCCVSPSSSTLGSSDSRLLDRWQSARRRGRRRQGGRLGRLYRATLLGQAKD